MAYDQQLADAEAELSRRESDLYEVFLALGFECVPGETEDVARAFANVEEAARELDALFDPKDEGPLPKAGDLDEWKLDGRRATGPVSHALLSLHDYLNDIARLRGASRDSQAPKEPTDG